MDSTRRRLLIAVGILSLLVVSTQVLSKDEPTSTLIRFEIKDQFDQLHTNEMYIGRTLVFVGGDREGSVLSRHWLKAIRDSLGDGFEPERVEVIGVAHLKGVPFFVKGKIKGKMPKEPENWFLLDWKGRFDKAYGFEKHAANILVFDRNGQKVLQTHAQEVEDAKLSEILDQVSSLLGG
jgi:hypothetical protein